jgi:hypothetical protein
MHNNYQAQLYPEDKSRTYSNPAHTKVTLSGDERLYGLRRDLGGFDPLPIELQILMHEAAFSIQGPTIYREAYVFFCDQSDHPDRFFANKKMILEKNGWKQRISVLFILTQRKMGKTFFLGQHVVIHAMNGYQDDMQIACISKTLGNFP